MREPPARRENLSASLRPTERFTTPNSAFSRARRRDLDARDRAFAAASRIRGGGFSRSGESAVATPRRRRSAPVFRAGAAYPDTDAQNADARPGRGRRCPSRQGFFPDLLVDRGGEHVGREARGRRRRGPATPRTPRSTPPTPPPKRPPPAPAPDGGLGLGLGHVGSVGAQPFYHAATRHGSGVTPVSYFPLRPNDTNDNDETECVTGVRRPAPPPPRDAPPPTNRPGRRRGRRPRRRRRRYDDCGCRL